MAQPDGQGGYLTENGTAPRTRHALSYKIEILWKGLRFRMEGGTRNLRDVISNLSPNSQGTFQMLRDSQQDWGSPSNPVILWLLRFFVNTLLSVELHYVQLSWDDGGTTAAHGFCGLMPGGASGGTKVTADGLKKAPFRLMSDALSKVNRARKTTVQGLYYTYKAEKGDFCKDFSGAKMINGQRTPCPYGDRNPLNSDGSLDMHVGIQLANEDTARMYIFPQVCFIRSCQLPDVCSSISAPP